MSKTPAVASPCNPARFLLAAVGRNAPLRSVLLVLSLACCTAQPLPDGSPAPPNYYIHHLSLEGGGG